MWTHFPVGYEEVQSKASNDCGLPVFFRYKYVRFSVPSRSIRSSPPEQWHDNLVSLPVQQYKRTPSPLRHGVTQALRKEQAHTLASTNVSLFRPADVEPASVQNGLFVGFAAYPLRPTLSFGIYKYLG
jgi:hypothetical protein